MLGSGPFSLFPAFLNVSSSGQIHGNLTIQHGSRFDSFSMEPSTYHVGHIAAIPRLREWMHQNPWAGVLLPFIIGLLCSPWIHARLKQRAADRLQGDLP
jgi:cellulose synthase (UDP-forming)